MKRTSIPVAAGAMLLFGVMAPAPQPASAAAQQQGRPAPPNPNSRSATEVLARMGQAAGVSVLADSTITGNVTPPAAPTTPQNLEQQLADITRTLGPGTTFARLYLPAPPAGRVWNGDDVAAYALAQAKLFGTVGAATPGTVEILGQRLPAAQAQAQITALNLKPVYLVTNPARKNLQNPSLPANWNQMTQEQRRQFAQQEAQNILNMDPALRMPELQQRMMVWDQIMRGLGPDQHAQLIESMGGQVIRTDDGKIMIRRNLSP